MGQATRTTMLPLNLAPRKLGGANVGKRAALEVTVRLLTAARAFYLDFFLAHPAKLTERVPVSSSRTGEVEERLISSERLLTWAEELTVATSDHPEPLVGWNFTTRFPDLPYQYRRSVIKDALGKVRGYLTTLATWQASGKRKGKPGRPGAAEQPTLYQGTFRLDLEDGEAVRDRFVRLKVFTGDQWIWMHYPVQASRYFAR